MIHFRAAGAGLSLLLCLLSGLPVPNVHAALPPLSSDAVETLRNPPATLEPPIARELEAIWAERASAFIRSVMNNEAFEFESQLWVDQLAGTPYLHFKASGRNRDYAADPRRNVVVVLFIGPTEQEINAEFGSWFDPFKDGSQFIESIDMGAERAAHTNMTDDGTHSIYWQQNSAFIEVRSRADVLGLAREAHAEARRTGIYSFPQSYLLTSFATGAGTVSSALGSNPESPGPSTPDPAATPAPDPAPTFEPRAPAQPSQEELAVGWERIEEDSEMMQPAPAPEETVVRGDRPVAEGPRIPTATLGLALHAAVRRDEASPVSALIRAGAGLEARDPEGRTPLMTAVESASPDLVRLLIAQGARLEAIPVGAGVLAGDQGMTPLMLAARAGRADILEVLLEAGASLTAVNGRGLTPLEIAEENAQEDAVRLLRQASGIESAGEPGKTEDSQAAVMGGEATVSVSSLPESEGGTVQELGNTSPGAQKSGENSTDRPGIMEQPIDGLSTNEGATLVTSVGEVRLWQARLEAAWKRLDVDLNQDVDASILRAVILNWDARVSPESTGVMGYEYWRAALADLSPENPVTAPDPSPDLTDERVVQALRNAAANLKRDFDAIEVPYSRKVY